MNVSLSMSSPKTLVILPDMKPDAELVKILRADAKFNAPIVMKLALVLISSSICRLENASMEKTIGSIP